MTNQTKDELYMLRAQLRCANQCIEHIFGERKGEEESSMLYAKDDQFRELFYASTKGCIELSKRIDAIEEAEHGSAE